ncbi:hypothetical protein [Campylobacter gracilis]|uniref:DUF4279 domain-containing protein n=1 Tax=Campylobacter gracilis RM3268 TaxID=553220 RepID=C8PKE1_9BACT|nr:hypothetical protein [Campylobacter gracilis]AKT93496.1 hypothetical protein CGRAC_2101 [Campylobacter gracilis]EEV16550.1 hypothetical protein CAMGR0001_0162 [Campylobacter gracilis RM3268]UEB46396.1 hypothetical protein LK410_04690 [Campylobacter gracilis]SUW78173.1 Uncharacterised protein [Campylobacter gracilis]
MKDNEVVLILSIESDRDLSETISSSGISTTKTWHKGDLKIKGSILKYKNFGFSIEEKFYDIPSAGDLIKKFLADINVARSIKLQSVKKLLRVVIYSNCSLPGLYYDTDLLRLLAGNNINLDNDVYFLDE